MSVSLAKKENIFTFFSSTSTFVNNRLILILLIQISVWCKFNNKYQTLSKQWYLFIIVFSNVMIDILKKIISEKCIIFQVLLWMSADWYEKKANKRNNICSFRFEQNYFCNFLTLINHYQICCKIWRSYHAFLNAFWRK